MKPSPANGLSTFYLFFTVLGLSILNDVFHLTDSELLLFFSAIFLADGLTAGTLRLRGKQAEETPPVNGPLLLLAAALGLGGSFHAGLNWLQALFATLGALSIISYGVLFGRLAVDLIRRRWLNRPRA